MALVNPTLIAGRPASSEEMNSNVTLAEVLAIEDDPALLERRCTTTGLLTWPLLRTQFLRSLTEPLHYPGVQTVGPPPRGRHRRALSAFPKVLWANARRWSQLRGDILIMASGAGHFQRSSRSFNRITDYFALESSERTVTIEGLMDWQVPVNRFNEHAYYFLPWQAKIDLLGKLRQVPAHLDAATDLVEFVRKRAVDLLDLRIADSQADYLKSMVATKIARLPGLLSTYRALLDRVRPKLVLLDQGCYSDLGVFNRVAREMNIRVAEPQHGLISSGHDAYSYSAQLSQESAEYRGYLPHDFLGYGSWWNEQINAPVKKWVIGHPHYIEQHALQRSPAAAKASVVILSDGFDFDKYLGLASDLASHLGATHQVVLRPRPPSGNASGRSSTRQARARSSSTARATSTRPCPRPSLSSARSPPGFSRRSAWPRGSTCGQHRKPATHAPHIRSSSLATAQNWPNDCWRRQHWSAASSLDVESIWAPDWRGNYRRYLERALQHPPAEGEA